MVASEARGSRVNVTGRRWAVLVLLAAVLGGSVVTDVPASLAAMPSPGNAAHQVLVGFKPGTTPSTEAAANQRHGGNVLRHFGSINADLVSVGNSDAAAKRSEYAQDSSVRAASLNYLNQAVTVPNDPSFGQMYDLNNTGQTGGTPGADVHATQAWDLATGAPHVVVADIDTGIDINQPDLAANIWTNPSPGPPCTGSPPYPSPCDDIHGWNTAAGTPVVFDPSQRAGDDFGDKHGTHTAGTIGAVGNNGVGIAGEAWNVQIMPVKFLNFGFGTDADAISAIEYARTHGAQVINASWGGGGYDQMLKDEIDLAGASGILFVAAAGNFSANTDSSPFYPASYASSNIISVAATNSLDQLTSWSDFGVSSVDLAAPGDTVLSTVPRSPGGIVWNGRLVYLAFGIEGLSSAASRQTILQRSLSYLSAAGRVLVVDDTAGSSYATFVTGALSALGLPFDIMTVPSGGTGATAAQMNGYAATIWLTGNDSTQTFLTQDQSEITNYLGGGGKLIVSGQGIGLDLDINNRARTWYQTTFHAQVISSNAKMTDLNGEPGGPFAGVTASIAGGDGANNQTTPEKIWPLNGATAAIGYPPYGTLSGTSMATPHVTAAVALLRELRPSASVDTIKSWIMNSVDPLPTLSGKVGSGGRLNLRHAMELALADSPAPSVAPSTVTSPNGGEVLAGGAARSITWNAAAVSDSYLGSNPIRLDVSSDGGSSWSTIASGLANSGSYPWTVPSIDTSSALIRLTATDLLGKSASDTSDAPFTIDSTLPSFGSPSSSPAVFNPGTTSLSVPVTEGNPASWTLTIRNGSGTAVRTASGSGLFSSYAWDGKNDTGTVVADGVYGWTVTQLDQAGNTATSTAGSVTLDSSVPSFGASSSTPSVFSPTTGGTSTLAVPVTATHPDTWTLTIRNGSGSTVRTASGSGLFSAYVWDGKDSSGTTAADGAYSWAVNQLNITGTNATSSGGSVTVDSTAPVFGALTSTPSTFSPSGGNATLAAAVTEANPASWTLVIRNGSGSSVRSASGSGLFYSYSWNGKDGSGNTVADGAYSWTVTQLDQAGNSATSAAGSVSVDSSVPTFGTASSTPALFSPALGATSTLAVSVTASSPDTWTLTIRNGSGSTVRTASGSGSFSSYSWDGKGTAGAIVPDGAYSWTVNQHNATGTSATSNPATVTIDSTAPSIGAPSSTPSTFNPSSGSSSLAAAVTEANPASWTLTVRNAGGTTVRTASGSGLFTSYVWNGKDSSGAIVPDGTYSWTVTELDQAGNTATSAAGSVQVDSAASTPTALAATPFSFDPASAATTSIGYTLPEASTVTIQVKNSSGAVVRTVVSGVSQSAGAQAVTWDGRDDAAKLLPIARYQIVVTATDLAGNVGSANTATEIIAFDSTRKGSWVSFFGTKGYVLPTWNKNGKDLVSLPTYLASYTVNSGSGLVWATKTADPRALTNPDGSFRNATAYSSTTEDRVTLKYKTASRGILSLYLLDWDTTARRETITITDADGTRTYPITSSFQGGLWVRVPISGTTAVPVTIKVTKTAGTTAVLSGIMFD